MRIKPVIALATIAVLALAGPAAALVLEEGHVTGGGFTRDGKGKGSTKKMLTLEAGNDGSSAAGRALYKEHSPGKGTPLTVRIELDCVVFNDDGNEAWAAGDAAANDPEHDWHGARLAVRVVDNGEGRKAPRDEYGIEQLNFFDELVAILNGDCGAGGVSTQAINGGNFQVHAG